MNDSRVLPLHDLHQGAGAQFSNFQGWRVPASFGDPEREYHAATGAVGMFDASFLTLVSAQGRDVTDYLNRRLSQRVVDMTPGQGRRANQLNGEGRMEADFDLYCVADQEFELLAPPAVEGAYLAALCDKYVFSEDARFADRTGEFAFIALIGPRRSEVLQSLGIALPDEGNRTGLATVSGTDVRVCQTEFLPNAHVVAVRSSAAASVYGLLLDDTQKLGGKRLGLLAFDSIRVESGTAWWGIDLNDRSIPLDADLMSAIHTNKGCYPGQETIAKILNLGHPARKLVGVLFDGEDAPPAGTPLQVDGREAGNLTSSTWSPRLKRAIGLATVRWNFREAGTKVATPQGVAGTVQALPFS